MLLAFEYSDEVLNKVFLSYLLLFVRFKMISSLYNDDVMTQGLTYFHTFFGIER